MDCYREEEIGRGGGGRDYWWDSDENWSEDNESRCLFILSSSVSPPPPISLIIQSDSSELLHSLLLIKKPTVPLDEFIGLSSPLSPSIPSSSRQLGILSSPPFFSSSPLSVWTSFLSLSLCPSLFHLFILSHCSCSVKTARKRYEEWEEEEEEEEEEGGRRKNRHGGNQRAQERKRQSPLWQMKLLYKKGGFSQFPVDILCSLPPPPPNTPLLPAA